MVNGVLEAMDRAESGSNTEELWIGGTKSLGEYFVGLLDETYIKNYAMTASEVNREYIKYKYATVAHWKFEEGTGTTIHDYTGNFNGTLKTNYSNPQWNWITGYSGNALQFDPKYNDHVLLPANRRTLA